MGGNPDAPPPRGPPTPCHYFGKNAWPGHVLYKDPPLPAPLLIKPVTSFVKFILKKDAIIMRTYTANYFISKNNNRMNKIIMLINFPERYFRKHVWILYPLTLKT